MRQEKFDTALENGTADKRWERAEQDGEKFSQVLD